MIIIIIIIIIITITSTMYLKLGHLGLEQTNLSVLKEKKKSCNVKKMVK